MKRSLIFLVSVLLVLSTLLCACNEGDPIVTTAATTTEATTPEETLPPITPTARTVSCLSFNVLGGDGSISGTNIAQTSIRFPKQIELINRIDPNIVCIQEATGGSTYDVQMIQKLTENGKYKYVKYGELSGEKQNLARGLIIFYKPDDFELLDSGYHNYSSREKQDRAFIWVKLRDKKADKELFVLNTHWSINWDSNGNTSEAMGDQWRTIQANEMLEFFKNTVKDTAIFACGDYNCAQGSKWQLLLSENNQGKYRNIADILGESIGSVDHCFVNPDAATPTSVTRVANTFIHEGKTYRMSDHQPLLIKQKY